jgi:hypothetical protein
VVLKLTTKTSTNESHSAFSSYFSTLLTYFKFKPVYLATKTVLENKIAITGRSNKMSERMLAF